MKVREEIEQYALEEDKEALLWLLEKFHWASEWFFVVEHAGSKKTGRYSYDFATIWKPTKAGAILFKHRDEFTN